MKLFSGDGVVILGAALLFTGIASATKTNDLNSPSALDVNPTYTANGTMSKQSALLLTNLLRNSHLQVKAEVGRQMAARINNRYISNAPVATPTYTASGKMSKQQAILLTNLLRNPHLQVKAEVGRQMAARINNRNLSNAPVATPTYTASGKMSKQQAILLTNLLRNPHLQVKAEVGRQMAARINNRNLSNVPVATPTYTASGKMSKQQAILLTNLLRNPHLQVKAEVGRQMAARINNRNLSNVPVATPTYTASGKMSKQQAILLTNLLRNPHLQVKAEVGRKVAQQQTIKANNQFIGAYKPFYYNGRPPVYIQGNTIWYPVPVATVTPSIEQAPAPMNYSLDVVSK